MSYRLVTEHQDYRDFASGSVLSSAPGYPAFPVRLAQELFLRAATHLPEGPVRLWDSCCGSGYLITVLGLLFRDRLHSVFASDADPSAITLTTRNLQLLTVDGLHARARELRQLRIKHDKASYAQAAGAADRMAVNLVAAGGDLPRTAVTADVFDPAALAGLLPSPAPDLVVTDVPYGEQTTWLGAPPQTDPLRAMVGSLSQLLPDHAVIALVARTRKISFGAGVQALECFRVGTRACFVGRADRLRDMV